MNSENAESCIVIILKLTRQAARWSVAALQDENPIISILHANYGAGYLWAIKDIVTTDKFNEITGLDYLTFEEINRNIKKKKKNVPAPPTPTPTNQPVNENPLRKLLNRR